MYNSTGEIYFYPKKYSNKAWAIMNCCEGVMDYYSFMFKKRYGINIMFKKRYGINKLQSPKHSSHITVIREEEIDESLYDTIWTKYQNEIIEFQYSPNIQTNGDHIWLPIICERLSDIREEMGLKRDVQFGYHLTIGRFRDIDKPFLYK